MYLAHLSLTNFRNYSRLELDLSDGITLLQGLNAQGKTGFLEAIAYLSTSRSLLSTAERELVNWLAWEQPLPFARIVGEIEGGGRRDKIEIVLVQNANSSANGPRLRKEVRINGSPRRAIDLIGQMPVVLFLPHDIQLIAGSPSNRRRYMDIALCQMQRDYCRALSAYGRVVQQRNALLKDLRQRQGSRDQLTFWDDQLIEHGDLVMARRASFLADLEFEASQRHLSLTEGRERLHVDYKPSLALEESDLSERDEIDSDDPPFLSEPSAFPYQSAGPSSISDLFRQALEQNRQREIAAGMSLTGPHRDDIQFLVEGRDLRTYGSRGQQRTATLSVKLAEVAVMQRALTTPPILLLDDVMSELDRDRRAALLEALGGVQQALVTTTDWEDFTPEFRRQARCMQVDGGLVQTVTTGAEEPERQPPTRDG
ncbi:MAG: DNA replication/repair protein RecF [Chloroflexota bacterium]|nr:DNA replication/repair protein RecF [Chloroflexota bacterium]